MRTRCQLSGEMIDEVLWCVATDDVDAFKPGDEVFSRCGVKDGGAYAEVNVARAQTVALKPRTMSFQEAAAMPLAGITALQGLRDCR